MFGFFSDLKSALRNWRRRPLVTLSAVLILGIGIAANTAVYSVVKVLLDPLPDSERIVQLKLQQTAGGSSIVYAPPTAAAHAWMEASTTLEALVPYSTDVVRWIEGAEVTKMRAARVTPEMFDLLGVEPLIGRRFTAADGTAGQHQVALLDFGTWQRRFGGRRDVLGETIVLDSKSYEVVGVLPKRAPFIERIAVPQLWLPLLSPADGGPSYVQNVALLRPGVTREVAQAEGEVLVGQLQAADQVDENAQALVAAPDGFVDHMRPALRMLQAVVALVLLIVCSNVAHLLLAQGESRAHELATRTVLGAGRSRLVRQLITESAVLSLSGGALALLLVLWIRDALAMILPAELYAAAVVLENFQVDAGVLSFNFLLCLLTAFVFGLMPAWQLSSPRLTEHLQRGSSTGISKARQWTRQGLVAAEVALTFLLLAGAGLTVRSLLRAQTVDPGFDPAHLVTLDLALDEDRYAETGTRTALAEELLARLTSHPAVTSGTVASPLPPQFAMGMAALGTAPPGGAGANGTPSQITATPPEMLLFSQVDATYFSTVGTPLLAGRPFLRDDADGPAAIINERLARRFGGPAAAVGGVLEWRGERLEVVGVAGNLDLDLPHVYLPAEAGDKDALSLGLRAPAAADPDAAAALIADLRAALADLAPHVVVDKALTGRGRLAERHAPKRFKAQVMAAAAGLAAFLAMLGIYAMVAHLVSRNAREIGVRVALGADRRQVVHQMTARGLRPVAMGWIAGLGGALALSQLLAASFHEIDGPDPAVFAAVAVLVALTAGAAVYLPARRAARVDPMVVLREE